MYGKDVSTEVDPNYYLQWNLKKATATGVYIAATMFAPIIVPPLAVWIAVTWGWRWVFFSFAIPGIVAAIAWYLSLIHI